MLEIVGSRKTSAEWFAEYAVCHQNRVNKVLHWICVPAIAAAVVGILWAIPVPWEFGGGWLNWAVLTIAACLLFYLRLSVTLAFGMATCAMLVIGGIVIFESASDQSVGIPALILFGVAWIGQFIGHKIEGKKPAFIQDLQFLLIGPAWVLDALFRNLGLRR